MKHPFPLLHVFCLACMLLGILSLFPVQAAHAGPETALPAGLGAEAEIALQPALSGDVQSTVLTFAWTKAWGGSADVIASNVTVDKSGNLYVVGQFSGTVNFDPAGPNPGATRTSYNGTADAFVSKFDANGALIWVRTFGGGPANPNLICGVYPTGDGRETVNGVGLDSMGNIYISGLFQYTVDFGSGFIGTSNVTPHQDMCGVTGRSGNNIFVARLSPDNGTTIWARTWGGTAGSESYSLVVDKSNNIYVQGDWSTGVGGNPVNFNPVTTGVPDLHYNQGAFDSFLSKFDMNGNLIWAKTWGGEGYDDGPGVALDSKGNVYVAGMYASKTIIYNPANNYQAVPLPPANDSGGLTDVFLVKFDPNGTSLWVRTWGGPGTVDAGGPITVDSADNVYIGGRFGCSPCAFNPPVSATPRSNGAADAFVAKYDSDGNFKWIQTWGDAGEDMSSGLVTDAANNIHVSGIYAGTVNFNPNGAAAWHTSNGAWDASLSEFDTNGNYRNAWVWGGSGNDIAAGMVMLETNVMYLVGNFTGTNVNFNPNGGADFHSSHGGSDGYLSMFYVSRPVTFADVPGTYWAWQHIERLYNAGITGGCSANPLNYCPETAVTRAQMAVFLLVAKHGAGYTPPAATGLFSDVPASNGFAPWIEQMAAEGITGGCGGGKFCPNAAVTREQMAVFLLVAEHGAGYNPPAAVGMFSDVPAGNPFARWIEQLANEGITGGCGGGKFCPKTPVTRAQMAVFLVAAFNLP
ncbi:MAG: S-layer homology domain-containing protein [Chloroflexota bacterium]